MSQKLKIAELKEHPRNGWFFDNITGDAWDEFLNSIRTSGVIEPIVVTQDKVIVSGHQRVRACRELHIEEIEAEVRIFDSEDEVLKQLIETNIRQRGIGNTNPVKFGRCLVELERIYGIHQGNGSNQYEQKPQVADLANTQDALASQLGISVDTLNRYKRLAQAIPEIQSLVESGRITKTIALALMKRLTEDEQKELAAMLPDRRVTSGEMKFFEAKLKKLSEENEALKTKNEELSTRKTALEIVNEREEVNHKYAIKALQNRIEELESAEPKTVEKLIEVVPDDYESLKYQLEAEKAANRELAEKLKQAETPPRQVDAVSITDKLREVIGELPAQQVMKAVREHKTIIVNGSGVTAFVRALKENGITAITKNDVSEINVNW